MAGIWQTELLVLKHFIKNALAIFFARRRLSFVLATARCVGEKPGSLSSGVGSRKSVDLSLVSLVYGVAL